MELIKETRYEDILNFYRDNYLPHEPIAKSLNLQWDGDIKGMITDILRHNLSLAMVSSETGEILGCQAMAIANRHEKIDTTQYKSESLRQYVNLTDHFDTLNNVYEHFKVEEIVFFFQLAVLKKQRQKGIGTTLVSAAVAFIESFDIGPVVLRVEVSSNFSMRIFEKLGFDFFAEIDHDEYKIDGKVLITNTGEHKCERLYTMVVG